MAVKAFRHAGIVVSDMERSLEFYRDWLGLEVWADFRDDSAYVQSVTAVDGANVRMVKLRTPDGATIELLQYLSHPKDIPPPRDACDVGCSHVAFQVDDVDSLYSELKERGIRFNASPAVSPDGYAKVAYCRDPEGVIVELVELMEETG